eukprot:GFKZ01015992.1.p1 GENE.GFKZ01015992.1~~GFKZ01015992.1.p1  ORF type:complete len:507 (+),score=61.35 GFKZ01015992.1:586-2106(+)
MSDDDVPRVQYPVPPTQWQQAEFASTVLTGVALALLTTLISYQLTAITSDLVLGWKPRNVARIHTFQSLLLSRKASPVAVANALFRTDMLTRFYFQGNLPARSVITRDHDRIRPKAVFLLLTLLLTAPLVNIASVIMTIENSELLSFERANFPTVSFGIWDGIGEQVRLEPFTEICGSVPIEYHNQDSPLVRFLACTLILGPERSNSTDPDRGGGVSILMNSNITLKVQVEVGLFFMEAHIIPNMKTSTTNWRVRMNVTREDAKRMAKNMIPMVQNACGSEQPFDQLIPDEEGVNVPSHEEFLIGYGNISCTHAGRTAEEEAEMMAEILYNATAENIVLRNDTSFDITVSTSRTTLVSRFIDGSSQMFVTRRTRLVGVPFLAILAGIAVFARMLVAIFLNNDVNDGIERILKERVGLPHDASLLGEDETIVSYNAPREDAEAGKLHPLRSYGAGSSFLPALSQKAPSTSQRTLVMFDGLSHGSTDWNREGQKSNKSADIETGGDMI